MVKTYELELPNFTSYKQSLSFRGTSNETPKAKELIRVLDENGVPKKDNMGENIIKNRDYVHEKGEWHRVALVCIINNKNQILLQKRASSMKKFADHYDISVATHVCNDDVSPFFAAKRAVNLELRLPLVKELRNFQYITCFRSEYPYGDNLFEKQFHDLFLVKVERHIPVDRIRFNKDEVQSVSWEDYGSIEDKMGREPFFCRTTTDNIRPEWIDMIKVYIISVQNK